MKKEGIQNLYVGQKYKKTFPVKEEYGERYASVTGDYNPIHLDEEYAKGTRFQGKIAHGMMVAGFISGVIGNDFPGHGSVYMKQDLKFLRPVRYGDEIKVAISVNSVDEEKNRVELLTECFRENDEKVITGTALIMLET